MQQFLTNKNSVNVKPERWSRSMEKHCVTTSDEERCALVTNEAVVEGSERAGAIDNKIEH